MLKKKYIAEMLGTMFLVLMGCGSAVIAGKYVGNLGIAFAFGLTVMVMVYAIGPISGCHINPAITIAMLVNKKISGEDAVMYIWAQFIGALLGAAVLYAIVCGNAPDYNIFIHGLGTNGYGPGSPAGFTLLAGAIVEFVFTALFLFVICGVISKKAAPGFAGMAIGLCLTLIHIVGIPVTGVSVNPARSFGPAVIAALAGNPEPVSQLWLFLIVPVLGGIFGAWIWKKVEETK